MTDRPGWMTDAEWRRHCFARYCWSRREQRTPSGKTTWAGRFQQIHRLTLYQYREWFDEQSRVAA